MKKASNVIGQTEKSKRQRSFGLNVEPPGETLSSCCVVALQQWVWCTRGNKRPYDGDLSPLI